MGRSWQWTRGSALLAGVGDDAAYVAGRVAERLSGQEAREDDAESLKVRAAAATERPGLSAGGEQA